MSDTMSYDPTDKVDIIISLNRSPESRRREDALAYGRSLESTDAWTLGILLPWTRLWFPRCGSWKFRYHGCKAENHTWTHRPGSGSDKGRNMPALLPDRGCKEALVLSVGYSAAYNASGMTYLLSPVAGVGTSQLSRKLDSRALSAGFSATHPVDTGKPGHGFSVPADGVRERPGSSRMQWQWHAENHRSRSVGSTNHGPR